MRPERSPFYAVLYQFFDRFSREYEQRFERTFGPLRGIVPKTVERFFGCGLPEGGFARIRCDVCGCAWKALSSFLRDDTGGDALPAAIISIQTAGEFLNWHPHLHVLAPAGAFRADGSFIPSPVFDAAVLRGLFQANVLSLLLRERMISPELVERMKDWRHSGFHAFAGEEIPDIEDALRVGLYMVRGPAATSRLRADPAQEPKVRYLAKGTIPDHGEERMSYGHRDYDYLEWIARLTSHIPERGTQLVHYYGAYSNAHRGIAHRREAFFVVPPEDDPPDPPRPDSPRLAARPPQDPPSHRAAFRPAETPRTVTPVVGSFLPRPVPGLRTPVEGPKVRRFHARRDGVMPGVRAEFGGAADPEGSIPAARRRGMRFHGA